MLHRQLLWSSPHLLPAPEALGARGNIAHHPNSHSGDRGHPGHTRAIAFSQPPSDDGAVSSLQQSPPLRVLVIEDDAAARDIITRWLRRHGYQDVNTAVEGVSGLAAALEDPPDVLFLDYTMPGLSGLGVAEYLCLHCPVSQRPWIVLFTAAPPSTIQQVMASGYFDDLLQKPCGGQDYEQAIARAHAGLEQRSHEFQQRVRLG